MLLVICGQPFGESNPLCKDVRKEKPENPLATETLNISLVSGFLSTGVLAVLHTVSVLVLELGHGAGECGHASDMARARILRLLHLLFGYRLGLVNSKGAMKAPAIELVHCSIKTRIVFHYLRPIAFSAAIFPPSIS